MATENFTAPLTGRVIQPPGEGRLQASIDELYDTVLAGLAHPDPARGYQAIALLCGHLAAMRRAVLPVASRQPEAVVRLAAACRAESRKTERALRGFECLLSGQSRAVRLPPGSALALLEQRLSAYRAAERAVLMRLDARLTSQARRLLTAGYHAAFQDAPTRPHPRCPQAGPLAGLMLRLCALRDRVFDAVDSRPARPAHGAQMAAGQTDR